MEIRVLRAGDDRLVAAAFHHNLAGRVTDEGAGGVPETDQLVEVWTFSP